MPKKYFATCLLGLCMAMLAMSTLGCGGSKEAVKPETLAPPPSEADEVADDSDG